MPTDKGIFGAVRAFSADRDGLETYWPGSVIFREDEPGDCAYIIERGSVLITRTLGGEQTVIAELGPGELMGEMAVIDGLVRTATATATSETELISIPRTQLTRLLEDADPLLRLLLHLVLERHRSNTGPETAQPDDSVVGATDQERVSRLESVRGEALQRVRMREAIRDGLARREFLLHFQPIVDLRTREASGIEALVRWLRPSHGLVQPGGFINVAEDTGLIRPLGLWILRSACEFAAELHLRRTSVDGTAEPVFMSVNVSPRQLRNSADVDLLIRALHDSGVSTEHVKLEITERLLIDDPDVAAAGLKRLKDQGVSIAIDDFGTGYSSLAYLHRFPIDVLKIDRAFVNGIGDDASQLQIVGAIAKLGLSLNMELIAEGIERERDIEVLQSLGVTQGQGYLFARPMSIDDARSMLGDDEARSTTMHRERRTAAR